MSCLWKEYCPCERSIFQQKAQRFTGEFCSSLHVSSEKSQAIKRQHRKGEHSLREVSGWLQHLSSPKAVSWRGHSYYVPIMPAPEAETTGRNTCIVEIFVFPDFLTGHEEEAKQVYNKSKDSLSNKNHVCLFNRKTCPFHFCLPLQMKYLLKTLLMFAFILIKTTQWCLREWVRKWL